MASDSLRIAVFHELPPGGAKRCLYEFCRHLGERGHLLDAYLPDTADEEFLPLDEVVQRKMVYPVPYRHWQTGGEKKGGPARRLLGFYLYLYGKMKNERAIAEAINREGYDLAFIHPSSFVQSPFVLRYLNVPSVYFMQEPFQMVYNPALWMRGGPRIPLYRRYHLHLFRRLDAENLRCATRVLANSYFSRESIQRLYGVDARTCYLGINTQTFRPLQNVEKGDFVLSVGNLHPYKGFGFIISSLALIPPARRPRLVIAAVRDNENEERALRHLAEEHGVELEISTDLTDEQLCLMYNQALAMLCASRLEPFGFTPLEAMACGTPVVGVREGGLRESIEDGVSGVLVDRDEKLFARAVEELLADPDLNGRMGRRGLESVREKWSWEKSADELIEHLRSVVEK